jgi:HK97 family phage major capsid protein
MTLLEIQDERKQLLDANDDITELSKAENRAKTEAELGTMQANLARLKELDIEEETEKFKVKDGSQVRAFAIKHAQPKERFSLMRTILDRAEGRTYSDEAKDIFSLGRREFAKSGVGSTGEIVIPSMIEGRANELVAGTATLGEEIVAEDKKVIIPPLVNKLVFSRAGATFMPNMIGNVSIPSYSGTTVGWKGEIAAADQGTPTFGEVSYMYLSYF